MLTHAEIAYIADEVFAATLGMHGFESADVADDADLDGSAAVRVTAHFKSGSEAPEGRAVMAALTGLQARLRAGGEERFAFVRYAYPDDDSPGAEPEDFVP